MPAGQAHTIWFLELKDILKKRWNLKLTISEQFELLNELNNKLNQIRIELVIQPPMMWCPKCQKRHRSGFINVSITAMYYALQRFELCEEKDFKKLKRDWKNYSKSENIDIYGERIFDKEKDIEEHN
jgi:uncharacterized protein (UPF0212 family)